MKKTLYGLAVLAALGATGAGAATLDFVAEANNNGERGVANGTTLTIGGVDVSFDAGNGVAYFDRSSPAEVLNGGAGLGVCSSGLTSSAQCVVSSDDNVTISEAVTLTFGSAQNISGLLFNAEGHHALTSDTLTLQFATNGGALASFTFADLMTQSFANVTSATFAYGGTNPDQYYVSALTAVAAVPLPATLPLMAGALGLLGFGAKRRRKQAA